MGLVSKKQYLWIFLSSNCFCDPALRNLVYNDLLRQIFQFAVSVIRQFCEIALNSNKPNDIIILLYCLLVSDNRCKKRAIVGAFDLLTIRFYESTTI